MANMNCQPFEETVRAWMSPPDHLVSPTTPALLALETMKCEGVRHLLVVDDDFALIGVVTDRDLLRPRDTTGARSRVSAWRGGAERHCVADAMTSEVITVAPRATMAEAARIMVENRFHCLPVIDDGEVLGIITSSDLLAALVCLLGDLEHSTDRDGSAPPARREHDARRDSVWADWPASRNESHNASTRRMRPLS